MLISLFSRTKVCKIRLFCPKIGGKTVNIKIKLKKYFPPDIILAGIYAKNRLYCQKSYTGGWYNIKTK